MNKPRKPAAIPAQEPPVAPEVKQARKKAAPKKPISNEDSRPGNPVYFRFLDGVTSLSRQMDQQKVSFEKVRGGFSFSVNGVFAFYCKKTPQLPFFDDQMNTDAHTEWAACWQQQRILLNTTPEILEGDAKRRAALFPFFGDMEWLHRDALAEIAALNRLFAGVTDQRPAGPYADYRMWEIWATASAPKEGQELLLTSAETTDGNQLAVRFGYRFGPDSMVCYAVQDQPAMKIKTGDRIFAPYGAA